ETRPDQGTAKKCAPGSWEEGPAAPPAPVQDFGPEPPAGQEAQPPLPIDQPPSLTPVTAVAPPPAGPTGEPAPIGPPLRQGQDGFQEAVPRFVRTSGAARDQLGLGEEEFLPQQLKSSTVAEAQPPKEHTAALSSS